jgi:hypothetical protein
MSVPALPLNLKVFDKNSFIPISHTEIQWWGSVFREEPHFWSRHATNEIYFATILHERLYTFLSPALGDFVSA